MFEYSETYLLSVGEGIARDSQKNSLLWVEDSTWWIDSESLHVGGLDTITNATSRGVDHLDVVGVLVVVRGIEDDLGVGLGLDVSWWDGLSHGDLEFWNSMKFLLEGTFLYSDFLSLL